MELNVLYSEKHCQKCLFPKEHCVCSFAPKINLKTKLTLIMHKREFAKPTNTGRWALMCLSNSECLIKGKPLELVDYNSLNNDNYQNLLLYPNENSVELSKEFCKSLNKTAHLIVPDGNWNQASRTAHRILQNCKVQTVKLPKGIETKYKLRVETREDGMSTLEAIANCLENIEGEDVKSKLIEFFNYCVEQKLKHRGRPKLIRSVNNSK